MKKRSDNQISPHKYSETMDNANLGELPNKSPVIDRNVIEELNNLDSVALRNLRDWDKRVAGSSGSVNNAVDPVQEEEEDREWSPDHNEDAESVPEPMVGGVALSYDDISGERPELSEGEVTDSDIETAGSDADRPELSDYEDSDVMEAEAEYQIAADADEDRQCWVCFASQEDDPVAAWVHPCLCKGTTKWVHQVYIKFLYFKENHLFVCFRFAFSDGLMRSRRVTVTPMWLVPSAALTT